MSGRSEVEQHGATNADEPVVTERGALDRCAPMDFEWVNAAGLRAVTPEEIELLAATGC